MKAGFARSNITPPLGTKMMGFGARDMDHGCTSVHDDIHVHALYLEHEGEPALIMGFDLCFLGREDADRLKGAIGRVMDLLPRQILLNTSHNHVGPAVGTWYSAGYEAPDRLYLNDLEAAVVVAAQRARDTARTVELWAGAVRSTLPMNRRRPSDTGLIENRPNPGGPVYDRLPVCLFRDEEGDAAALLFSVSCHPSMIGDFAISAEYPGAAVRRIDEHLGASAGLFLQGVGGDAKPSVIGAGASRWKPGTWELVEQAGELLASEVIEAIENHLVPVEPALNSASVETLWRLQDAPGRSYFEDLLAEPQTHPHDIRRMWAARQLQLLDSGRSLPNTVPISIHGLQLGKNLRIVGMEGEALHSWGHFIDSFYGNGITFPLGYTDGEGLYLPDSSMLDEGGYEVESYWEYGLPAPLDKGMEHTVREALGELRVRGIR